MFNFGLLVSHIPYIVFIAAYLLYLLTQTIYKLNDNEILSNAVNTENRILVSTGEIHEDNTAVQNTTFSAEDFLTSVVTRTVIPEKIIQLRIIIPPEDIHTRNLSYSLFSRPPPLKG